MPHRKKVGTINLIRFGSMTYFIEQQSMPSKKQLWLRRTLSTPSCRMSSSLRVRMCFRILRVIPEGVLLLSLANWVVCRRTPLSSSRSSFSLSPLPVTPPLRASLMTYVCRSIEKHYTPGRINKSSANVRCNCMRQINIRLTRDVS
jgi:hypothetical protein